MIWHIRDRIAVDYLPAKAVFAIRRLARFIPDFIIGNSLATLRTLDLTSTPTAAISSGVDPQRFSMPATASIPLLATSTPQTRTIGLIGRLCPWKGQHIFIQAAKIVHQSWPNVHFQIVGGALFGEQAYEAELHAMVAREGLGDVFDFTGFQSDVAPLIGALYILVHASTVGEPFGQVIVQAMASGKAVVATNGGGVPESVIDGQTGILVPLGDVDEMAKAIATLLADSSLAEAMGRRGRERVIQHFAIDQVVDKVMAVYRTVARD